MAIGGGTNAQRRRGGAAPPLLVYLFVFGMAMGAGGLRALSSCRSI